MRKRASEQEKYTVRDREKERDRDPPRRAGEPCLEELEGRKTKRQKELQRERE